MAGFLFQEPIQGTKRHAHIGGHLLACNLFVVMLLKVFEQAGKLGMGCDKRLIVRFEGLNLRREGSNYLLLFIKGKEHLHKLQA